MELKGNTELITGGATGIRLAVSDALLDVGNDVIVCARTEENLEKLRKPALNCTPLNAMYQKRRTGKRCMERSCPTFQILISW